MTNQRLGLRVAGLIFALISIGHIVRVVVALDIRIGGKAVAMWPSILAAVAFGVLGVWLWRLSNRSR